MGRTEAKKVLPDWLRIIPAAQSGEPAALKTVFDETQPLIYSYLESRVSEFLPERDIDNLAGTVWEAIVTRAFPKGEPTLPLPDDLHPDDVPSEANRLYKNYISAIASKKLVEHIRKIGRGNITIIDTIPYRNVEMAPTLVDTHGGAETVFSAPRIVEVFNLWREGEKRSEIAQRLHVSQVGVRQYFHRARKVLDREFLEPTGLKRGFEFPVSYYALRHRLQTGQLQGAKVLDLWYTREDWIENYKTDYQQPPHPGYSSLASEVGYKNPLYNLASNNLGVPELGTIIKNGRIYVHTEGLYTFYANKGVTVPQKTQ